MFDLIRKHIRLTLGFLLLLIIPSFVFFGVEGYKTAGDGSGSTVAEVDGRSITRGELDNAIQRNLERARLQRPGVDPQQFNTPEFRRESLDNLVRERVLQAAAFKLNLGPTDSRLQRMFATDPQFAQLRNPDGSVNRDMLAMQGMSSEYFAQTLRQEFAMQQVLAGITRSVVAPPSIVSASLDPLMQRRDVQFQTFEPAAYVDKVKPTDAQIEAFYQSKLAEFKAPESASIEYVMLDLESLTRNATPGDEELRKFYADNGARFTAPEERQASHILINADKSASAADKAKAKERAEALLAEARKSPAGFAELARKNSQDPGSAVQGGDLGFFGRGAMVKPFEDAAFTLKPGEISNVVESDFGFHVIQLVAVKGGQKRPFEEVRAEIETELSKTAALKRWSEMAEQFTNTVYEQSESLQPVIDKLKLEKKTAVVQRKPAPGASGALASAKLLDAVFGNETLKNKRNTDAVEVASNQLVAARVVTYTPTRELPLAEVKPQVLARLLAQQTLELARKDGQTRLTALQQATTPGEPLPNSLIVSRVQPQGMPRELLDAVMRVDSTKLPSLTGVDLGPRGYVVIRVRAVLPREPVPGGEETLRQQYAQAWAAAEAEAYVGALKQRFKTEIKASALAVPGDAASAPIR